jgi:transglutaminase-like putative cysteine protease
MVKFMKSVRTNLSFTLLLFLSLFGPDSNAQNTGNTPEIREKYAGYSVINEFKGREVNIEMNSAGIPATRIMSYNTLYVLTDNAQAFAESKEYFTAKASLESFKAYSRVADGKKYKDLVVKNYIKSTEINDGLFYDDTYVYTFNFPLVAKDSRLVTESEIRYDDPFYPIMFNFGGSIPYDSSLLTITIPETVKLNFHLFGNDTSLVKFSKTIKGKRITYQWSASGLPAYSGDEYSPGFQYYTPHIIVHIAGYQSKGEYIRAMETVGDMYAWNYGNISRLSTRPSPEITQLTDSLLKNCSLPVDKARIIFRWVQKNIKYIAIEDGDNGFVPREADLVFKRRYGDCKDKSSLLKAMFLAAGLDANLAWIGTRDLPYLYSVFPSMANDDHMICVWWNEQGEPVFLDGTTRNHSLSYPPAFIQGKECMVEKGPGNFKLVKVPVIDDKSNTRTDTVRIIQDAGKLTGKAVSTINGELKARYISRFESTDTEKYKDLLPGLFDFASNKFQASGVQVSDLSLVDQPLTINFNFELPDYATSYNDAVYINMNVERLFRETILKPGRSLPLETESCFSHSLVCILDIPAGNESNSHSRYGIIQSPEVRLPHTILTDEQPGYPDD